MSATILQINFEFSGPWDEYETGYAASYPVDMSATLKAFPMKLKSVEEYARSVVG